jgi:hypothetical protein
LVDWSGDGERALLYDQIADEPTPIIVDLHAARRRRYPSGAAITMFRSRRRLCPS